MFQAGSLGTAADGGGAGEGGVYQVDVATADQIFRQLSGAPPADGRASVVTKPSPSASATTARAGATTARAGGTTARASATTARATPTSGVRGIVGLPEERPALTLPAFFEALAWHFN